MTLLILLLLIAAFIVFVVDAVKSRGALIAVGLACWVLAEIVAHWP